MYLNKSFKVWLGDGHMSETLIDARTRKEAIAIFARRHGIVPSSYIHARAA